MSSTHSDSPASAACRVMASRRFSSSAASAAEIASRSDWGVEGLAGSVDNLGRFGVCLPSSGVELCGSLVAAEAAARCMNCRQISFGSQDLPASKSIPSWSADGKTSSSPTLESYLETPTWWAYESLKAQSERAQNSKKRASPVISSGRKTDQLRGPTRRREAVNHHQTTPRGLFSSWNFDLRSPSRIHVCPLPLSLLDRTQFALDDVLQSSPHGPGLVPPARRPRLLLHRAPAIREPHPGQ